MKSVSWTGVLEAGPWIAERASGELRGPDGVQRLEPKVMDLLYVLAGNPGHVWSRDELMATLWPGVVVGEDSLARTVSKLRQALGDDAKAPRYVETIARRGYRWMAPCTRCAAQAGVEAGAGVPSNFDVDVDVDGDADVDTDSAPAAMLARAPDARVVPARRIAAAAAAVLVLAVALFALNQFNHQSNPQSSPQSNPQSNPATPVLPVRGDTAVLLTRADHYYFQFSRADNESALELYQRVLGLDPDDATAMAGLANALAQRAIRWPTAPGPDAVEFSRLGDALAHGHMAEEPARSQLQRARQLAQAAVARAPVSASAHKALGLVLSAQGETEAGLASHRRAVELDPEAWAAMINIADLLEQLGRDDEALPWFRRAYEVMARTYDQNPVQVRHWHEMLGVLVAERHRARGALSLAEAWYRRVLILSPLHRDATLGLAAAMSAGGDHAAADQLCAELQSRRGPEAACARSVGAPDND